MLNLIEIANRVINQRVVKMKKEGDPNQQFYQRQSVRHLSDLIFEIIDISLDDLKSSHDGQGKDETKRLRKVRRELEKTIERMNEQAALRGIQRHGPKEED